MINAKYIKILIHFLYGDSAKTHINDYQKWIAIFSQCKKVINNNKISRGYCFLHLHKYNYIFMHKLYLRVYISFKSAFIRDMFMYAYIRGILFSKKKTNSFTKNLVDFHFIFNIK